MSDGAFAEKPASPKPRRCLYCGEMTSSSDNLCWLCLEKISFEEDTGEADYQGETREGSSALRTLGWVVIALVIVTLGAVLTLEVPGFLIAILVVGSPFLGWMFFSERQRVSEDGGPGYERNKVAIGVGGTGCAILVGLSAIIAFFVVCFSQIGLH